MRDPKPCPHGADLKAFGLHYGKKEEEILDFSSNVNPLGFPETVASVYRKSAAEISKYPDPYASELCEVLAARFGVPFESVIAGNGSMEIFDSALRVLKPRRVLLAEPCFNEYRRLAQLNGAEILSVKLRPSKNFSFPLRELVQNLSKADLVILGHPNNPTGTAFSQDEMKVFLKEARLRKVFVILDEAFADWMPGISVSSEAGAEGLLIVRSLTKFYALAGIRAGFALGPQKIISSMKEVQGPWTCNRLAQKLSVAALEDPIFPEKTRRWLQEEKLWLQAKIQSLDFLKIFPSLANFFLIENATSSEEFRDFLGRAGIYVRGPEGFRGLGPNFFRIAIRKREDNELLIRYCREAQECLR